MYRAFCKLCVAFVLVTLVHRAEAIEGVQSNDKVLYSFCSQPSCADGSRPYSGVIEINGFLYGVTANGGAQTMGQFIP